jgi:hypothetical protein
MNAIPTRAKVEENDLARTISAITTTSLVTGGGSVYLKVKSAV